MDLVAPHKALSITSGFLLNRYLQDMINPQLRVVAVWCIINLTYPGGTGTSTRVTRLKNAGVESLLQKMADDPCLDVKVSPWTTLPCLIFAASRFIPSLIFHICLAGSCEDCIGALFNSCDFGGYHIRTINLSKLKRTCSYGTQGSPIFPKSTPNSEHSTVFLLSSLLLHFANFKLAERNVIHENYVVQMNALSILSISILMCEQESSYQPDLSFCCY